MPEAGPHNTEYTQHHPDAIVDRDLAEDIAQDRKLSYERLARLESLTPGGARDDQAVEASIEASNARDSIRVMRHVGDMPEGHETLDPETATDEEALAAEIAWRKKNLDDRATGIKGQLEEKERIESEEDH